MNHALVIAGRELRDRSRLFLLAAAVALIPFIAAALPGSRGYESDIIAMGGSILGIALGIGTAITLGNTTIGRELSERRLSFYFAKPISPAALWTGKAVSALLASVACFLIIALPAFLVVGKSWSAAFVDAPALLAAGIVGIVVFFFVSHAVSTIVRSRSPLIALDLVALVLAAGAMVLIVRSVALSASIRHAVTLVLVVLGAMLVLLMIVPVRQLAQGRIDARRGHAAFSRLWWPAVGAVIAVVGIYSAWLVRPALTDITHVQDLRRAPAGDWVLVGGETRHRGELTVTFAVNPATGQRVRLTPTLWWGSAFSRDGRVLAWLGPVSWKPRRELALYVLRLGEERAEDTGLRLSDPRFALADDASRVAIANEKILSVHDLATKKIVASVATGNVGWFFFAEPNVVRVYQAGREGGTDIFELDLATRSFVQTGHLSDAATVGASADGSRLYVRGRIVDARTGAMVAALPEWEPKMLRSRMLSDGSVARCGYEGGAAHLRIYDTGGVLRHDLVLPGVKNSYVAGDTADGKLIVLASREVGKEQKTFVVDPKRGVIEQVREGILGPYPSWGIDPRVAPFRGDLVALDLRSWKPVLWKPGSSETRPLF